VRVRENDSVALNTASIPSSIEKEAVEEKPVEIVLEVDMLYSKAAVIVKSLVTGLVKLLVK
jgi:hypothetical protein